MSQAANSSWLKVAGRGATEVSDSSEGFGIRTGTKPGFRQVA